METLFGHEHETDEHAAIGPPPRQPGRWRRPLRYALAAAAAVALFTAGVLVARPDDSGEPAPQDETAAAQIVATSPATIAPTAAGTDSVATTAPVTEATSAPATATLPGTAPLSDASDIGRVVVPSVVTIEIGDTFGGQETLVGSGSGVVYSADGYVITNAHVVEAGSSWVVVLSDGRTYQADLVGVDLTTDLAVLQIDAGDLTPISVGSTAALEVGDPAVAVGSPLGLEGGPSLSAGVVSAFDRLVQVDTDTTLYGMLQADAPITQGSSGGALVDARGRLIGITSAVGVSEVGVEGIGFSTPVEIVVRVVDEIIESGEATNPFLGITGTTAFGPTGDGGEQPIGVQVESVATGSAAEAAGIEPGDVVTSIDGLRIDTMQDLIARLRRYSAGDHIQLATGDGQSTVLDVTLGNR